MKKGGFHPQSGKNDMLAPDIVTGILSYMNTPIIFLDFDGVIRVSIDGGWVAPDQAEFCQERMKRIASVCIQTGAQIVVSSDWRQWDNQLEIEALLQPHLTEFLHNDWATPICGFRHKEVARWLAAHPEVTHYAILEDYAPHFDGCSDDMKKRLVLCTNRYGFVPELVGRTIQLLTHD